MGFVYMHSRAFQGALYKTVRTARGLASSFVYRYAGVLLLAKHTWRKTVSCCVAPLLAEPGLEPLTCSVRLLLTPRPHTMNNSYG